MSLAIGTRLGAYEIVAPLGKGGMGEVYRARDAKLDREVAIKVLPEAVSQDAEKLARFGREAHLLASVNHPNIATLYGLEQSNGQPFLVMELIEGETLVDRLAHGPMPVEEALPLFQHIAEGLEAAHEKGIIHRDLKPSNIKITPEGVPKILDFGLAKVLAEEGTARDNSQSPTLTRDATGTGVILGTAAYMSPEQARGTQVDKRTDIFSFGSVLYEALSGKNTFSGEDVSDVLAAVIRSEPDWEALHPEIDPRIHSLLRRCLRKDRKQRLQAIGDVRLEIQDILESPSSPLPRAAAQPRGPILPWALMGLFGLAFLVSLWTPWRSGIPSEPAVRLSAKLGTVAHQLALQPTPQGLVVLSRDGRTLVFVGQTPEGRSQLYVRSLDSLEASPLSGTEEGHSPFFSPDGQWLGFFTFSALKRVPVRGGPAQTIAPKLPWPSIETAGPLGGVWGPDDTIVFAPRSSTGLYRVPASGGNPVELTQLSEGEASHGWPSFLPNGKAVLFTAWASGSPLDQANIEAVVLDTGERKVLQRGGAYPRYASSGHLLFTRESTVFAVPFDADRIESTGEPSPVIEGVRGGASFSLAGNGTLVYVPGAQPHRRLVRVDQHGEVEPLEAAPGGYVDPAISPDGRRIAFAMSQRDGIEGLDLWIYEWERNIMTRVTVDPAQDGWPLWTPDGAQVLFQSDRHGGPMNLYAIAADGSSSPRRLTESGSTQFPSSWSPDGKVLATIDRAPGRLNDVVMLPFESGSPLSSEPGAPVPFVTSTNFWESKPMFSPDGRFVAYESDESGEMEVHVRPFPGPGGRVQVSNGGGSEPRWSPKGGELFYRNERALFAVPYTVEDGSFQPGAPRLLFEGAFLYQQRYRWYDVFPDGEHFLMMQSVENDTPVVFVVNWLEELERFVPTN